MDPRWVAWCYTHRRYLTSPTSSRLQTPSPLPGHPAHKIRYLTCHRDGLETIDGSRSPNLTLVHGLLLLLRLWLLRRRRGGRLNHDGLGFGLGHNRVRQLKQGLPAAGNRLTGQHRVGRRGQVTLLGNVIVEPVLGTLCLLSKLVALFLRHMRVGLVVLGGEGFAHIDLLLHLCMYAWTRRNRR